MSRRIVFAILAASVVVGIAIGWLLARPHIQAIRPQDTTAENAPTGRVNLLLLGADERPGVIGRSDTAILVSADLGAKKVSMVSLPRDTWVNIPGRGWDKLGHAFAYGEDNYEQAQKQEAQKPPAERKPVTARGEQLTLQTVNGLLDTQVDHYAVVNMQGFEKIVDTLGGVTIDVEKNLDYDDPVDSPPLHIHLKQGVQRLDGEDALKYVRFRHDAESDFGRMARQQKFLKALADEALKPKNLTKLPALINQFRSAVRTDLSNADLLRLGLAMAKGLTPGAITSAQLTATRDHTFGGIYYLEVDLLQSRKGVYQALHGAAPDEAYQTQAREAQSTYRASIVAEQQRQAELAKAAEEAVKQGAAMGGAGDTAPTPGGTPPTPGTTAGTAPATSMVVIIDASGKALGAR
ncbi:MAG: LCP family protein [Symbiobacteriia bacterium]